MTLQKERVTTCGNGEMKQTLKVRRGSIEMCIPLVAV